MVDIGRFVRENELFDGHYKLLRPLSTEGGTADVWLAVDVNTIDAPAESEDDAEQPVPNEDSGMLVAIKIYRPKNALDVEGEQRFRDEYKIVYGCRHTNLLQPTSFSIFGEVPYLVLPYCRLGSSEQFIGRVTDEKEIWRYVSDVASGLHYLHTNNPPIIHQDIKPANILVDNNGNFAITDFGISTKRGGSHEYGYDEEHSGTLAYMAPERFSEPSEPMWQSDIWAFGATLYEIIAGRVPFGEEGGRAQAAGAGVPDVPSGVSADLQRLIQACLSMDPASRPSAAQLIEAARAGRFPSHPKRSLLRTVSGICIVMLAGLFAFLFLKPASESIRTNAELYEEALRWMNGRTADSVRRGLVGMDSLGAVNYVPALYEMAFTYGWYSDSVSVRRKRLLGIEMFDGPGNEYLPVSFDVNNRAARLFTRIIELNDPAFPEINAHSLYRLACYFVNTDKVYSRNFERARGLLERSLELARRTGDTVLVRRAANGLKRIDANK